MGARKKLAADKRKEARKSLYFASANDIPSSPRKMRLVADMVRGMEVGRALGVLRFSTKAASYNVRNCCVLLSLTGSRRTSARPRMASCTSHRSL